MDLDGNSPEQLSAKRRPWRRMPRRELEEHYRRLNAALIRHVSWKMRFPVEDAEDVVQDAFVVALTKMGRNGNARAWFVRVVDQISTNLEKKNSRRAEILDRWRSDLLPSRNETD